MKDRILLLILLLLAGPLFAENVDNYTEQGGARTVIGGELDIVSGGRLEIEGTNAWNASDGSKKIPLYARFTYDVSSDGGSVGAHTLSESIPAEAVVWDCGFQIITQFTDSGSGTVALSCESANDIFSAADITGDSADTIKDGVPDGSATNAFDTGADGCDITATVASSEQTAGKLVGWCLYYPSET